MSHDGDRVLVVSLPGQRLPGFEPYGYYLVLVSNRRGGYFQVLHIVLVSNRRGIPRHYVQESDKDLFKLHAAVIADKKLRITTQPDSSTTRN